MHAKFIVPGLIPALIQLGGAQRCACRRRRTPKPSLPARSRRNGRNHRHATPTGTIVTRRTMANAPAGGTIVETGIVDAVTVRMRQRRATGPTVRELVTQDVAARPQRTVKSKRTARNRLARQHDPIARPEPRVTLSPADRHIVYQTIVEREVRPQIVPQQLVVVAAAARYRQSRRCDRQSSRRTRSVVQQPATVYTSARCCRWTRRSTRCRRTSRSVCPPRRLTAMPISAAALIWWSPRAERSSPT